MSKLSPFLSLSLLSAVAAEVEQQCHSVFRDSTLQTMDFFTKFTKARNKPSVEIGLENESETPKVENKHDVDVDVDVSSEEVQFEGEEDEDDDFITNEVKRRLKELRRNSFMVLIPEESSSMEEEEDEEEDDLEVEMNYNECRTFEEENRFDAFHVFDKLYDQYCDRMLVFDCLSSEHLKLIGGYNGVAATPSPRSGTKKLALPFRCLSLKPEAEYETETQIDLHQDLETSYVSQVCLTWEVLHSHYTQLCCQTEQPTHYYNYIAEQFQQFQVLLQRYIENEPFEHGSRVEIYARARNSMPKLLQVPDIRVSDSRALEVEQSDLCVAAADDFIRIIESSIMTFQLFLKIDKKKSGGGRNLFGGAQNQLAIPIREIRSSVEQKQLRLKELRRRKKSWKKKSWPSTGEEVELLFGLIDIKLLLRVLRTEKLTKEQLLWCNEKLKKIEMSDGKLQRYPSPILFPC